MPTAWDFSDLRAVYVNCTFKRSPAVSNTQGLGDRSIAIMEANGVTVEQYRAIDYVIAPGVYPDDPQGRPHASLAIKRQTRAFEDSSKASPLVPRRACRNRRGHRSQHFHPLGIGG